MKKIYLFSLFFSITAFAQVQDAWIYFSDKPDAEFYLGNPLEMLSQRALDRRSAQNIPLDALDVPIHEEYVTSVAASAGITVMARSKWLNAVHVRGLQADVSALSGLAFVSAIDFADDNLDNLSGRISAPVQTINPAQRTMETLIDFPYGASANQIQMLNGHVLHEQDYTGSGKIIAVLDAGFPGVDTAQPFQRLWDNNLILGGYNYVDGNEEIFTRNNHGTLVLSTMGGYTADELVGTAPDAQYYLFITEDNTSENPVEESYWVEAAERADSLGVDVINSSLGYFGYDNPGYSYSYSDMDGTKAFVTRGADIAFTRGMIVVASAGNSGASSNPNIGAPADGIHVLTVGAVTATEEYTPFSSIGPSADGRIKPDVSAQGVFATVAGTSGTIGSASGTSFSSPILAGAIASFWQAVPGLTNQEVVDFVRQSADQFSNPDALKGYGVPDFALALDSALGLRDISRSDKMLIWPNPASQELNVKIPDFSGQAEFVVYNAIGQKVKATEISDVQTAVDCSALTPGVYFYALKNGTSVQTGQFIKKP